LVEIPSHRDGNFSDIQSATGRRLFGMLSATADYALRSVLFLGHNYGERVVPADEIARAIGAPTNYLSKTLNVLTKAGIATSVAGRRGGFALAIDPAKLTLARVVGVFDDAVHNTRCLLGDKPCNAAAPCAAHTRWSKILHSGRAELGSTTIADFLR
jgi:Rrf2 family protein